MNQEVSLWHLKILDHWITFCEIGKLSMDNCWWLGKKFIILEEESWSSWRFSKLHQPWWAYRSSQIKHPIRPLCPPPVLQETEAHPAARGREHPTSLTDPQKKWSNCPARSAGCTACTWELMQRGRLSVKSEGIGRQSLDLPSTKHGACKQEQNDFWRPFWH